MKSISVKEFDKQKDNYILLDIRETEEILTAKIDSHVHIPTTVMPQRHQECQFLEQLGYDITNLAGGIDAWSVHIDPDLPRY